ncbi:D-inositol-3-phosphate glycosyltransferase [subsurface metagenome]|nr:glycosyltransferase [Clostridia bacterium]
MEKIKVAYFRTQFWFGLEIGGSVSHTIGVLKGFKENKCDLKVFSNEHFLEIENYNHFVLQPRLFKNRFVEIGELLYNFYAQKEFGQRLKEYNPTFIYHRFSSKTFFVCRLAKKLHIPIVLEFNGSGYWLSIFSIYKKNFAKRFLNNVFRKRILRLIEHYNFKNSTLIIAVSVALKNGLLGMGIPEEKIMVIPNGVDIDKFDHRILSSDQSQRLKKDLKISKDKKIVGFVGTFGPWHGIENLVSAVHKITEDDKNSDIIFLLIGDGALKRFAMDKIGRFKNVIFVGSISYSKIQYYLSICDVLVSPHSSQPDGKEFIGSPTKIFEYMAMGKGIVASNLGQIGEILENEKMAILIKPGDTEALVNGILMLMANKKLRLRLGKNAIEEVYNNYTWDINIRKLLTFMIKKEYCSNSIGEFYC